MFRLAVTAIAFLLAPLPAAAQDWWRLEQIRDVGLSFVDLDSVRTDGGHVTATTLSVRVPSLPNSQIRWTWLRIEYDCAGNRAHVVAMKGYDADRVLVSELDNPDKGQFRESAPGTEAAKIMDFLCDRDRAGAVRVNDPWVLLP